MAIKCAYGDEIPRKRLCPIFCENRIGSGSDDSRTKNSTIKEKSDTSNEIGNFLRFARGRTLKNSSRRQKTLLHSKSIFFQLRLFVRKTYCKILL